MAVEVYRVMFSKSSCCQCHIYIYIYTLAWILKCLKLYPSISLIDDSAAATQPLSRCASVADAATQPLCQSGWSSHSATQPLCQSGRRSHSATQPLCRRGWRSSHSDTQPLCRSGWRSSHSATQLLCQTTQPLSHSARVAGAATQPLSHSARVAGPATQPLSHSVTLPEWLSGWVADVKISAIARSISHSATLPSHSATQPLCRRGWKSSHSDTQPPGHSARVAGAATQPLSHSEWLSGWVAASATLPSGWVAEWLMWKFPPLRVQSYINIYRCVCVGGPESKGISRGPSLSSLVDGQRRGQWWELQTYLRPSTFGHGQVAKLQTTHADMTC